MKKLGHHTVSPEGSKMYGSHSARGGGALAMALAGWSEQYICKWGRWESDAVQIYILDGPILNTQNIASSMRNQNLKVIFNTEVEPLPEIGDEVRVWIQNDEVWLNGYVSFVANHTFKFVPFDYIDPPSGTNPAAGCIEVNTASSQPWYKVSAKSLDSLEWGRTWDFSPKLV